jgi:hypothetical protein
MNDMAVLYPSLRAHHIHHGDLKLGWWLLTPVLLVALAFPAGCRVARVIPWGEMGVSSEG